MVEVLDGDACETSVPKDQISPEVGLFGAPPRGSSSYLSVYQVTYFRHIVLPTRSKVGFGALCALYGRFSGAFRALIGRSSAPRPGDEGTLKALAQMYRTTCPISRPQNTRLHPPHPPNPSTGTANAPLRPPLPHRCRNRTCSLSHPRLLPPPPLSTPPLPPRSQRPTPTDAIDERN